MLRRVRILALLAVISYGVYVLYGLSDGVLSDTILTIALLQLAQGMFAMYILTYAWEDPAHIKRNSSPTTYANPTRSFTALLPCVNEADVVGDTMRSIASINYPTDKKELLVVLRDDDPETVAAAEAAKSTLPPEADARIVLISGEPRNKPHHLNVGLKEAKNDIVCIFDAEDEPHPEIYNIVNTTYQEKQCDVVQSGVQLMNFDSNWYSLYNCLEYFLWFRSALHYFARQGIIPLGGNTVFFKRDWLNKVGGWDLACLTEDADIGIRLSSAGAKTAVIYDPEHATREETPPSVASFVKQRTRWNQGFLQIIRKHRWGRGSALSPKQQALALSVLAWPILYSIMLILVPFVMASAFFLNVHPIVGLVTNLPALLLVAFLLLQVIALQDFARIYSLKLTLRRIGMALLWFVPYLLVLEYSAFRAVARHLTSRNDWEKTEHIGAHRAMVAAGAES
jgi:cellulose synthase/poly-beta-1,6-N-acetylglucosamine synthase-like glycosyltransferase